MNETELPGGSVITCTFISIVVICEVTANIVIININRYPFLAKIDQFMISYMAVSGIRLLGFDLGNTIYSLKRFQRSLTAEIGKQMQ